MTERPPARLRVISPTLLTLARRGGRHGFTLIEIMVAVGLASIIILTAVSAFRAAVDAMSATRRLSVENSLLRIGFEASMEDVDFFHSEANERAPFLKGFTRVRTQRANDPATPEDDRVIRRHFQPIRFMNGTSATQEPFDGADATLAPYWTADAQVLNPNVLLAHDPRSIDRGHLYASYTPDGVFRGLSTKLVFGDYLLTSATDMRSHGEVQPTFPADPTGAPVPIPINLDALNADTGGAPTVPFYQPKLTADFTENIPIPLDMRVNQALPLMYWQLFNRISLIGVTEYLSCGYNIFIQDQHGRPPDSWPDSFPWVTSPAGFPENRVQSQLASIWWRSYMTGSRDFANFLGCNFGQYGVWALGTRPVLGVESPTTTGGYDEMGVMTQLIQFGDRTGGGVATYYMGWSLDQGTGEVARNDQFFTSKTVRLPYNLTDGDRARVDPAKWVNDGGMMVARYNPTTLDYTSKPEKYPVMTTSLLRYRRMGGMGAIALAVTTVEDPLTGQKIELPSTVYGSTYRGARQHWRLYSARYADAKAIGDFYDDAAGPFYAP